MRHTSVHDQPGRHIGFHVMSLRGFILLTMFYIVAGLAWTGVSANWAATKLDLDSYLLVAVLAFGLAMGGAVVSARADSSFGSLAGFVMMATGLGVICGPALTLFSLGNILLALLGTVVMVLVLGLVGALIPSSLRHWWPYLLGATVMLIYGFLLVPALVVVGILGASAMSFLDWLVLVVFGLWVIYDLNLAVTLDRIPRNAADVAAAIYLDFLNIFLSALDLIGSAGNGVKDWWSEGSWTRGGGSGSSGSWIDWSD